MNVLLLKYWVEDMHELLPDVIKELKEIGPEHRYRLVHDVKPSLKHMLWSLGKSSAVISFRPIDKFKPNWAQVWQQEWITKAEEYKRMEAFGIPVPKWVLVTKDHMPDLSEFSDFVVVKPASGAFGAMVRVLKKIRVQWQSFEIKKNNTVSDQMIVQEFIHTGPWPSTYRVGTCFGEPYYTWRVTADKSREPFDETQTGKEFFTGKTIVSTSKGCVKDKEVPEEVLEFAKNVHRAFPNIPLLGIDIVRDYKTGKLYVIEVNASGGHFHLTTDLHRSTMDEFGFNLREQFGGVKAVARGIYNRLKSSNMGQEKENHEYSASAK
jgi:hypothetical protein